MVERGRFSGHVADAGVLCCLPFFLLFLWGGGLGGALGESRT